MNKINRDTYGAILTHNADEPTKALVIGAQVLARQAAASKRIPAAFDNMEWERINSRIGSKRIGDALHHEIYDVSPDGRKALVCCREVEGTRYGIKTVSKTYYALTKHGRGVRVSEANKAIAAKAAKGSGELGQAIEVCEGRAKLAVVTKPRGGYKLVERNEAGELVSVWDDSPWALGVTRTEAATDDHTGGYYYYKTEVEAICAAWNNEVFGTARNHCNLVLIEVCVSGKEYRHGAKRCVSSMTPVRVVRERV